MGVTYQLKPGYNSLDIFKYNATYAAEQLALWKKSDFSRYDTAIASVGFLNWKQILGDDTALIDLAKEDFGNSTNVIDHAKLSFLSDYDVPQVEVIMSENTNGPVYPPMDDPLYGSDFVTITGIASKWPRCGVKLSYIIFCKVGLHFSHHYRTIAPCLTVVNSRHTVYRAAKYHITNARCSSATTYERKRAYTIVQYQPEPRYRSPLRNKLL